MQSCGRPCSQTIAQRDECDSAMTHCGLSRCGELRDRNLRGIYMYVVEGGEVGTGDPVDVIFRASTPSPEGERPR